MREITLEQLLEAGCHFGHQVTRQNPKARDYVFEARDNIHIIDLAKTKEELEIAANFIKNLAAKGGNIVVVGTKRQAKTIVEAEVKRANEAGADGLFLVTNRWIGGILTNFTEVAKNYKKLEKITHDLQDENAQIGFTKKEIGGWAKEKTKLTSFYGGVAGMTAIPDALFVIDTHMEDLAVREANKMGVPIVGMVDTNADPTVIDYPIPANDDAVGSIELITKFIIDAWIEGKKEGAKQKATAAKAAEQAAQSPVIASEAKQSEEEKPVEPKKAKKEKAPKEIKPKVSKKTTKKTEEPGVTN
ncbi:MAG: 30S ribosomal protein S2 [Candidatus Levybacteria bacterium]|nr:30S ribosomal protein S2 [Candidatus Levybacteria bacterium]